MIISISPEGSWLFNKSIVFSMTDFTFQTIWNNGPNPSTTFIRISGKVKNLGFWNAANWSSRGVHYSQTNPLKFENEHEMGKFDLQKRSLNFCALPLEESHLWNQSIPLFNEWISNKKLWQYFWDVTQHTFINRSISPKPVSSYVAFENLTLIFRA